MAHRRRSRDPQTPRGTVYPLLDLHGHTGAEARLRAESWLRARAADGERTVVVVTGRGNRSQGLPVLRGEIEHLLAGLAGDVVARWEHTDGGGGFRVQLRPAPPGPSPSADAATLLRGIPPALLRRAEEALHDLGITPTPALLRAEARRIESEDEDG
jgi:hypothetical protein